MTDQPITHAGEALRAARQAASLPQSALAKRWGVRQATISEWERSAELPGYLLDAIAGLRTITRLAQRQRAKR